MEFNEVNQITISMYFKYMDDSNANKNNDNIIQINNLYLLFCNEVQVLIQLNVKIQFLFKISLMDLKIYNVNIYTIIFIFYFFIFLSNPSNLYKL